MLKNRRSNETPQRLLMHIKKPEVEGEAVVREKELLPTLLTLLL